MIKTMFAFTALALAAAAPVIAQDAPAAAPAGGPLPRCSATVRDSCDQGANNPRAMTADQAMASGGVGDRKSDSMAPAMGGKTTAYRHKTMHHKMQKTTTTTDTTTTDKPM